MDVDVDFVAELIFIGSSLAYALCGLLFVLLGYVVMDWLTPGKLGELIFVQRNRNAAAVLASNIAAVGLIVAMSIVQSAERFAKGIVTLTGYGIVGIAVLALAFKILDWVTPGRLGDLVTDPEPHPAVWITVAGNFAIGITIAASIS